jgi:2-dehydropantoate 2-reductase
MRIDSKNYLLVGNGRAAKHLKKYFTSLNISFTSWDRKSDYDLESIIFDCDIILLAISDSAIEPFIHGNKTLLDNKIIVHFSGALSTDLAFGCHPLMTFTNNLYEESFYKKILFTLDDDDLKFNEIFPMLKNPHIKIPKKDKAKYHALCVMANNYTCLLWQKFFNEMIHQYGAESNALIPFLNKTAENIALDYKSCLTGPLSRNDHKTLDKNIKSLEGDSYQEIYKSFVKMYGEKKINEN